MNVIRPLFLADQQVKSIDNRLEEMEELQEIERIEEEAGLKNSPKMDVPENMPASFMSESIYGKLNSPQARKRRAMSMNDFLTDWLMRRAHIHTRTTKTSGPWEEHPSTVLRATSLTTDDPSSQRVHHRYGFRHSIWHINNRISRLDS